MLAERSIVVDAVIVYRSVQKCGPEIRKRAYGRHRGRRELTWHVYETYPRVNGRWCTLWRALDQHGRLIDFRLTARRTASAARVFMRQARDTVRLYQPLTIIAPTRDIAGAMHCRAMDKARSLGKVIGEWNARLGPEDAVRQITRKLENNRIEGDHAVLKHRLRPMRRLQGLSTAEAVLKGVETFRAIRRADFETCEQGVLNEIRFVRILFENGEKAA